MHAKYQRRLTHAGRELIRGLEDIEVRAGGPDPTQTTSGGLSGPITLTFIQTLPIATSASSTEWTTVTSLSTTFSSIDIATQISTSTSTSTTSALMTTTTATVTASTTSSSTSTFSTITSVPSLILPPSAPSVSPDGNIPVAQGSLLVSQTSLSGGAIAGIVIGGLAILAAVFIYFLRRRFIDRRKRSTGAWGRRSMTISPFGFVASNEPKANLKPLYLRQDEGKRRSIPEVVPPFAPTLPKSSPPMPLITQPAPLVPIVAASSPFLTTVICTFVVSLPDELNIAVGEKMKVVAEYDDGWALCTKTNGEQGMVPLECLDRSRPFTNDGLTLPVDKASRRISSLISNGSPA